MIVSEKTKAAEGLGKFYETLGKSSAKAGKKINVRRNPGSALEKVAIKLVLQLSLKVQNRHC